MNTNNDNNSINATPEQGVIPFPYSSTSSPILVNVDSIVFGDNSSPVDPSLNSFEDTKVIDPEMDLIQKIKSLHGLIKTFEKNQEHWKIRKFKSVVEIGEHLVTIRKKCNEDKVGFKKLVETEFVNEFCYKTAIRYMFLFNKRSELASDVCTIRKAYKSLGILKEEYLYPDNETDNTQNPVESNSTPQPKPKKSRIRKSQSVSRTNLFKNPGSLMLTPSVPGHSIKLYQIMVENGKLRGMDVEGSSEIGSAKSVFEDIVFNHLKPFVEWYNQKDQRNKEIESFKTTVYQLEEAA
jgi:hypothetical protein